MVILADAQREIGSLKNANVEFDVNNKKMFTVQIARCYWTPVSYTHLTLPTKRIV